MPFGDWMRPAPGGRDKLAALRRQAKQKIDNLRTNDRVRFAQARIADVARFVMDSRVGQAIRTGQSWLAERLARFGWLGRAFSELAATQYGRVLLGALSVVMAAAFVAGLTGGGGEQPNRDSVVTADAAAGASEDRNGDRAARSQQRGAAAQAQAPAAKPQPAKPVWGVAPLQQYKITSGFGQRWGTMHAGVDFAAGIGTPVRAVKAGKVELAAWHGGYGKAVVINHGNGVRTLYGHNSKLLVRPGQVVKTGQPIALVGSTGQSTGPHLHLEVMVNYHNVDPLPWLKARGVVL